MFNRSKCKKCNEKISKKYNYCPYCGVSQKDAKSEFFQPSFDLGFPFNIISKKLFKEIEKQFQDLDAALPPTLDERPNENNILGNLKGLTINIDNKNGQPIIRINSGEKQQPTKTNLPKFNITPEKAEKIANLPRAEPETKVTRLTNKLIYELDLPGVNKENIIITKLENSIEIKAFSDDKSFSKLIPMALPVLSSNLKEGKLTLELKI